VGFFIWYYQKFILSLLYELPIKNVPPTVWRVDNTNIYKEPMMTLAEYAKEKSKVVSQ
jgi:hypothetical protein